MALRINTNIAAMNAHKNMIKTDNSLSESLGRLSSGLRINKAADDASGMGIADSLRSQALGLGQAIRNGNDGISIVQTADAALEESINIVNTIKQKSIQAAQDGQTTDSRKAIQADITKLRDELDIIAKTTSFNNQKLLSGNFTDKKFQIGAYSGETIDISIQSSEASKIGHISTANLSFASEGTSQLAIYSNTRNESYNLNSVEIAYDNNAEHGIGAVADSINVLSDRLGITADASVTTTTDNNIAAGTTDSTFAINGVQIGAIAVSENDSTGTLVAEINQKTDQHGVLASINQGFLTLTSTDDRAIEVTQGADTIAVLGGTADMSTFGTITLTQQGTSEIKINNRLGGTAVALVDNALLTAGTTTTTQSSTLASGSNIVAKSTIAGGSILSVATGVTEAISGAVFTTGTSVLGSGSVVAAQSTIAAGSTLEGQLTASGVVTGEGIVGSGSTLIALSTLGAGTEIGITGLMVTDATTGVAGTTGNSVLGRGSIMLDNSTIAVGSTWLASDLDSGGYDAGTAVASGLYLRATAAITINGNATFTNQSANMASGSIALAGSSLATGTIWGEDVVLDTNETTVGDMTVTSGTSFITDTVFQAGTNLNANLIVDTGTTYTTGADMTLAAGSNLATATTLADDTQLSNDWINTTAIDVVGSMTLEAGSSLVTASILAEGSSIGGTVTTAVIETVDDATDMRLAAGSVLATGSTITAGTFLTNDVVANDGETYLAGSALNTDIVTSGSTVMTNAMTLNGGSVLQAGTTLAANDAAVYDSADASTSAASAYRLSDLDVTSQEGAQIAISIADAALKNLDKVRSDLGSVQNQLTSTIANISTTRVNVAAAESTIRDVDFAEESSNFTKMQILAQAGTFAMSQANASSQNVLSLLQ